MSVDSSLGELDCIKKLYFYEIPSKTCQSSAHRMYGSRSVHSVRNHINRILWSVANEDSPEEISPIIDPGLAILGGISSAM